MDDVARDEEDRDKKNKKTVLSMTLRRKMGWAVVIGDKEKISECDDYVNVIFCNSSGSH